VRPRALQAKATEDKLTRLSASAAFRSIMAPRVIARNKQWDAASLTAEGQGMPVSTLILSNALVSALGVFFFFAKVSVRADIGH
jgi:hypothetical protein